MVLMASRLETMLLTALTALTVSSASAEVIKGRLYSDDGAVQDANIVLQQDPNIGTTSGIDGTFSLDVPDLGGHLLDISHVAYNDTTLSATPYDSLLVELFPASIGLDEVTVQGESGDTEEVRQMKESLAPIPDGAAVLYPEPGVSRRDYRAEIYIGGLPAEYSRDGNGFSNKSALFGLSTGINPHTSTQPEIMNFKSVAEPHLLNTVHYKPYFGRGDSTITTFHFGLPRFFVGGESPLGKNSSFLIFYDGTNYDLIEGLIFNRQWNYMH